MLNSIHTVDLNSDSRHSYITFCITLHSVGGNSDSRHLVFVRIIENTEGKGRKIRRSLLLNNAGLIGWGFVGIQRGRESEFPPTEEGRDQEVAPTEEVYPVPYFHPLHLLPCFP